MIENNSSKQGYHINEITKKGDKRGLFLANSIKKIPKKIPNRYEPASPRIILPLKLKQSKINIIAV